MLRTAWTVLGRYGRQDGEDVVQEALVAALTTNAWPEIDLGAWLRAITVRKALDELRARRRRREEPHRDLSESEPLILANDPPRPELLDLRLALAKLSALDRAVLVLVDLEGLSMREAATALGTTTLATKWRAVRARRRLRGLLESPQSRRAE